MLSSATLVHFYGVRMKPFHALQFGDVEEDLIGVTGTANCFIRFTSIVTFTLLQAIVFKIKIKSLKKQ